MLKHFLLQYKHGSWMGAGVAWSGLQQPGSNVVQDLTTIIVLVACLLPIVMAVFGAVALRLVGHMAAGESTEDEVVPATPTLPPGVHLPDPTIWPAVFSFGLMGVIFGLVLQSWFILPIGVLLSLIGLIGWIVVEVKEFQPRRRS
jgi:hypothetical protein